MWLKEYFYYTVGGVLLLISPYVIVYEGNTLIGIAFAVLGVSLLIDESIRDTGAPDEENEKGEGGRE